MRPAQRMPGSEADLLLRRVNALRDSCRATHGDGPGGATICICGAGCGGSAACSALREIRDVLAVAKVPAAYRERLEMLQILL